MNPSTGDDRLDGPELGWARAIGSGVAILAVGFVAGVYGTNALVTRLTGVGRSTRQYLAAIVFVAVVIALAWALRRLQERRLI